MKIINYKFNINLITLILSTIIINEKDITTVMFRLRVLV